jgi:hypothetical protein
MNVTLTRQERGVLTSFLAGMAAHQIADEQIMTASSVRGILHRTCNFEPDAARALLGLDEATTERAPTPQPPKSLPTQTNGHDLGLTYRQLDYWTRNGLLKADNQTPGSGNRRTWAPGELAVAVLIGRLVDAGISLRVAHDIARGRREIGPGITIKIDIGETP